MESILDILALIPSTWLCVWFVVRFLIDIFLYFMFSEILHTVRFLKSEKKS